MVYICTAAGQGDQFKDLISKRTGSKPTRTVGEFQFGLACVCVTEWASVSRFRDVTRVDWDLLRNAERLLFACSHRRRLVLCCERAPLVSK